jgi:hypothetical protein
MQRDRQNVQVRVDGYTRVCLTAIAVLLTVLVVGLWAEGVRTSREARGAVQPPFDSSKQRGDLLKAQEQTSAKLEELIGLFRSGAAKVTVTEARPPEPKPRKADEIPQKTK